jgi:hypothetical protein
MINPHTLWNEKTKIHRIKLYKYMAVFASELHKYPNTFALVRTLYRSIRILIELKRRF